MFPGPTLVVRTTGGGLACSDRSNTRGSRHIQQLVQILLCSLVFNIGSFASQPHRRNHTEMEIGRHAANAVRQSIVALLCIRLEPGPSTNRFPTSVSSLSPALRIQHGADCVVNFTTRYQISEAPFPQIEWFKGKFVKVEFLDFNVALGPSTRNALGIKFASLISIGKRAIVRFADQNWWNNTRGIDCQNWCPSNLIGVPLGIAWVRASACLL